MRENRRSGSRIAKLLLLLLFIGGGYWYWRQIDPERPVSTLAAGIEALAAGDYPQAKVLLGEAVQARRLRNWALLNQARMLELTDQTAAAIEVYRSIPANAPASLDARLALLRLEPMPEASSPQAAQMGQSFNLLEQQLTLARRTDLLPELLLLRARAAEAAHQEQRALTLYREIRRRFPKSDTARAAKEAQTELLASSQAEPAVAGLLEEAELLLHEGDPDSALALVQKANEATAERSPARFEILLVEEKVLRALRRNEEADHLLAIVSADGGLDTADRAMLKMIRNAWNANERERGLQFIENFERRFPSSALLGELLYIKGRLLEEQKQIADARQAYLESAERSSARDDKVKALRQIAWLHYLDGSFKEAAEQFHAVHALFQEPRAAAEADPTAAPSGWNAEQLHARYWEADARARLGSSEDAAEGADNAGGSAPVTETAAAIWKEIARVDPYGYYGILSRRRLGSADASDSFSLPPDEAELSRCTNPVPRSLLTRLELLETAALSDYVRYEIDWFFAVKHSLDRKRQVEQLQKLKDAVTRAQLYNSFGHIARGLGSIDVLIQSDSTRGISRDALKECEGSLISLGFPLPYQEEFSAAAEAHGVSLPLLYGVSRTESHFDPLAKSGKDAMGLLQLLATTAKAEGLQPGEDLFDPAVNVRLGAKHLSGLRKRYGDEEAYVLAAYNAGASAVERWRDRYPELEVESWIELIGYPETKNYVKKVLRSRALYEARLAAEQEKGAES